jgi:hypothetical protein
VASIIDVTPEIAAQVECFLPRGVTIISQSQYGGAIRMEIQGPDLGEGNYQLVVTDEPPLRKVIELKLSPFQDA